MHEFLIHLAETYAKPCQTSKMERFAKIVNDWKYFTIFERRPILDVWQMFELDV